MITDIQKLQAEVDKLSREVGKMIREARRGSFKIDEKSFNNLVTEIDKRAEEQFVEGLIKLLPGSGFIAEEGTAEKVEGGPNWIIDPIDGTTNFVHNVPLYCTSVALWADEEVQIGVIYDPSSNELFSSSKGHGTHLNGEIAQVSEVGSLSKSLIATGFPYDDFGREKGYFEVLRDFTHNTRGIRRLGSAALDMAYVAVGRFDAFYEYGLNPWDVAAGILLIEEAGGECSDFNKGRNMLFGEELISSNRKIHREMHEVIHNVFGKL